MEIINVIISNKKPKDLSTIANIWLYVISVMKTALDSVKTVKDSICNRTGFLYERFLSIKKKYEKVHEELKGLLNAKGVDEEKIRELQKKQDLYSKELSEIQGKMGAFWNVNMSSAQNGMFLANQAGYKFVYSFENIKELRR
jgi:hypothetical protein